MSFENLFHIDSMCRLADDNKIENDYNSEDIMAIASIFIFNWFWVLNQ